MDPGAALLAACVLAGSALFGVSAGAVMTDGALVLGSTLCMHAFWVALHAPAPRERRRAGWLFFAGLALGLLAKGPLALVLVGLPLVPWTLWTRRCGVGATHTRQSARRLARPSEPRQLCLWGRWPGITSALVLTQRGVCSRPPGWRMASQAPGDRAATWPIHSACTTQPATWRAQRSKNLGAAAAVH
jgi:hypothetical protein